VQFWQKQFDKLLLAGCWLFSIIVLIFLLKSKLSVEDKIFWIVLTWAVSQSSSFGGALMLLITGRSGQSRTGDQVAGGDHVRGDGGTGPGSGNTGVV
jgi:hypothetical protein